jgi:hypothetical protein
MTAFVLVILVGTAPAYQRGTFDSYTSCVEAGVGQVESLKAIEGQAVQWQCLPISDDTDAR